MNENKIIFGKSIDKQFISISKLEVDLDNDNIHKINIKESGIDKLSTLGSV